MKKIKLCNSLLFLTVISFSCKKLVEADFPPNQLTVEKVFSTDESALAATANMYTLLSTLDNFVLRAGTYVDELDSRATDATALQFSSSVLTADNTTVKQIWQNLYYTIYKANSLVEGVGRSGRLTDSVKNQCLGEAKFIRAFCHFYLVNIFGSIPLVSSTEVGTTSLLGRSSTDDMYKTIITDLTDARNLLPGTYPANGARVRATKFAAAALLARAHLYRGNWAAAEAQASYLISSGMYSLASSPSNVFLASSPEAIFLLWNTNGISGLATSFIPSSGTPLYSPTTEFLNSFETGDQRKTSWFKTTTVSGKTYFYPFKYKQRTPSSGAAMEYSVFLRLAEQYLIRAEARARENKITEALQDLNIVRNRAGLAPITAATQAELLSLLQKERRIELFTEGGHRFFDLKRWQMIDLVMQPIKPLWRPIAALFPIPQSEILLNPSLSQNPGYN